MGGSQSRFQPDLQDVWFRMNITGTQPLFLHGVLQAIVHLKEPQGSSLGNIIEYIQCVINAKQINPKPNNVVKQVKRALKYATKKGLLKQTNGKFKMILDDREFTIFTGFGPTDPIQDYIRQNKNKKKKKKKSTCKSKSTKKDKKQNQKCCHMDRRASKSRRHRRTCFDFYSNSNDSSDVKRDIFSIPSTSISNKSLDTPMENSRENQQSTDLISVNRDSNETIKVTKEEQSENFSEPLNDEKE